MTTKNKILLVLNLLVIGLCAFFLVHTLFFEDSPNIKLIIKAAPIVILYSLGVGRFLYSYIRNRHILFSNQYLPFFTGAFQNDKKYRKKLDSIGRFLNKGRYEDAYTLIEALKKECTTVYDRVAVLLAEALCLIGKMNYDTAYSILEKALLEYPNHATALALRSLLQQRNGRHTQALETLQQLTSFSTCNYAVHLFKAVFHLNRSEYTLAAASAKDALAIDSSSALSMLVAYKSNLSLKNEEVAEYYSKSIQNFGNTIKEIEKQLNIFLI